MADVITRLKVDSQEYDARLKRATQSLNEMTHAAEVQGNKIATANQKNIALAKSLGNMQTVSTTARGKMQELSSAIESATLMYNRLSAAEKKGTFGRALSQSVNQLQGRLKGRWAVSVRSSGRGLVPPSRCSDLLPSLQVA